MLQTLLENISVGWIPASEWLGQWHAPLNVNTCCQVASIYLSPRNTPKVCLSACCLTALAIPKIISLLNLFLFSRLKIYFVFWELPTLILSPFSIRFFCLLISPEPFYILDMHLLSVTYFNYCTQLCDLPLILLTCLIVVQKLYLSKNILIYWSFPLWLGDSCLALESLSSLHDLKNALHFPPIYLQLFFFF